MPFLRFLHATSVYELYLFYDFGEDGVFLFLSDEESIKGNKIVPNPFVFEPNCLQKEVFWN